MEALLEFLAKVGAGGFDEVAQPWDALRSSLELHGQPPHVQETPNLGAVDERGELGRGRDRRHVDEQPLDGRARDVTDDGDLPVLDALWLVQPDPRPSGVGAAGDRHVDHARPVAMEQTEVVAERAMGEEGSRSAGENRGHPARVWRGAGMPDGVDATMLAVERSGSEATAQLVLGDEAAELPTRHSAVLRGCERGEGEICRSVFPARVTG